MAKMIILFDDIFSDYSVLSATTEATGYPKEYLDDPNPANKWRSTVITESIVKVNMGAAVAMQGACMINHNMVAGDTTFKFEASSNDFAATHNTGDFTLKTFDVKGVTKRNAFRIVSTTYQYYQWRLQKVAGTYIEFGTPFIAAKKYEFIKSENMDYIKGRDRVFVQNITRNGHTVKSRRYSNLIYSFDCFGILDAQRVYLEAIGEYDYVCILPENTAGTEFHFGVIEFSLPKRIVKGGILYWQMSGKFTESAF